MLTKDKILEIPIDQIVMSDWDIRRTPEDPEEIEGLTESIKMDGLLNPITVTPKNGHYQIIAGRRRLRACKLAGFKNIISYVKFDKDFSNADIHKITFIENFHRKELKEIERAYGILKRFEDYGYTGQQSIQGVKTIYNYISTRHLKLKSIEKSKLFTLLQESLQSRDKGKENFIPDEQFIEICKDIGKNPNYQYQLLQLILQVQEDVMDEADKKGLSTGKKIMLTHSKLRKYPQLQKNLIERIKDEKITDNKARDIVHQTINDLETAFLVPSETGKTFTYSGDRDKRDLISGNKKEAKQPNEFYMDIHTDIKKLMFHITGHQLSRGETKYTEQIVKNTHNHRLEIAKSLDSEYRALFGFYEWYLKPAKEAIDDMMKILDEEMNTAEKKKELMKE